MIDVDSDPIQKALQDICNNEGEGWTVAHYAVAVGLERMGEEGVESLTYVHCPNEQPEYVTKGLLDVASHEEYDRD